MRKLSPRGSVLVAPAPGDIEQSAKGVGDGVGVGATVVAAAVADGAGEVAAGVGLTVALDGGGLPETVTAVRLGLYPASAKIVAATTMNSPAAMARPFGRCHPDHRGRLGPTFIRRCNGTGPRSFRRA
jgi:hypothetical protein